MDMVALGCKVCCEPEIGVVVVNVVVVADVVDTMLDWLTLGKDPGEDILTVVIFAELVQSLLLLVSIDVDVGGCIRVVVVVIIVGIDKVGVDAVVIVIVVEIESAANENIEGNYHCNRTNSPSCRPNGFRERLAFKLNVCCKNGFFVRKCYWH